MKELIQETSTFSLTGAAPEPMDPAPQRSQRRVSTQLLESTTTKPGNEWMVTYLDTVTLLITLLVMILSFASFEKDKFEEFKHGMSPAKYGNGIMLGSISTDKETKGRKAIEWPRITTSAPSLLRAIPEPVSEPVTEEVEAQPQDRPETKTLATLQQRIGQHGLGDDIQVRDGKGTVEVEIKSNVLFSLGRADLTDSGVAILTRLSGLLLSHGGAIVVEGHTDNLPIKTSLFPSNWELSGSRASSVARHFIANGIGSDQIKIVGFADTRPLVPNTTPEQRQQNRRVNIMLELPAAAPALTLASAKQ